MKLHEQIRRARECEELSVRELARRFHVHRRDVRQALASAVRPERKAVVRAAPALDRWKPTIDGWLEADRTAPRKQRHTARRVWQRLVEEHGAQVGESTVRRYVAEVRRRMDVPLIEVMVPQDHPLGAEAEVDFGTATICLAGVLMDVSMFVMRLSASGRGFTRAYLNEAQTSSPWHCTHARTVAEFDCQRRCGSAPSLLLPVRSELGGRDRRHRTLPWPPGRGLSSPRSPALPPPCSRSAARKVKSCSVGQETDRRPGWWSFGCSMQAPSRSPWSPPTPAGPGKPPRPVKESR